MDTIKRNLLVGLAGIALLLVGILVYAQVNAAHNFEAGVPQQQAP